MKRRGLQLLFWLLVLYAGYAVAMIVLHPKFIYPFSQKPFVGQGYQRLVIPVDGATPVDVQVFDGQPQQPVILYFMGNVGALELFRPMLEYHKEAGRGVVAMTYRGGGGVPGTPSEAVLKRDALAVFDAMPELMPNRQIVVQGYSLGTGLAMHVAARRPVAGVILSAPYDRLCQLMARAARLPACLLPVQRWDSAADAAEVKAPVLVLHGTQDKLIPYVDGARLAGRLSDAGTPVTLAPVQGASHTDLTRFPHYFQTIDAFFLR